jgi:voltage-gated potassium channel
MDKRIAALRNHYLVCGTGDVGHYVIDELLATKRPFVAIDTDEAQLKRLFDERSVPYVMGDATEEAVLIHAGIKAAAGVVCSLPNDRDNLVLAMTCRLLNPDLRIAAKAHDVKLLQRLRNAGADAVVSPQFIGGLRLVSEMVRPTVVHFLDQMLRETEAAVRVEEVRIEAGSRLVGTRLRETDWRERGLLVMALQVSGGDTFQYVPDPESVLAPGCTMIVLGNAEDVGKLRAGASGN